nr:MAG: hypothetical protein [Bacteriophage sp.]
MNAEINSSVTNEAGKLSRFEVNGDPYAFLSEVNTKVSKSGDTVSGTIKSTAAQGFNVTVPSGWAYTTLNSGSYRWDVAVGE